MMTSLTRSLRAAAILSSLALAACVPQAQPPAPAPAPAPAPSQAPAPPPSQAEAPAHWLDAPQTPGDWFYSADAAQPYAAFGANPSSAVFLMRCDRANRIITLGRASRQAAGQAMRIHTETASRQLTAAPRAGLLAADVPAGDLLLDAMAISKGRFAVETGGETTLYLPSWPEVTRVIEDCR